MHCNQAKTSIRCKIESRKKYSQAKVNCWGISRVNWSIHPADNTYNVQCVSGRGCVWKAQCYFLTYPPHLIPVSEPPVGNATGSIKANCDFTQTLKTARVSSASRVTSVLTTNNQIVSVQNVKNNTIVNFWSNKLPHPRFFRKVEWFSVAIRFVKPSSLAGSRGFCVGQAGVASTEYVQ